MLGDEANPLRSLLDISYPIAEGRIQNWDDFTELWNYTFRTRMGLPEGDLKDYSIMVTEAALNPVANRKKMG